MAKKSAASSRSRKKPATARPKKAVSKKKATKKSMAEKQGEGVGDNLEKVRELLFGTQQRENDRRIEVIEKRIVKELEGVREEARQRLDSLERYVKSELESVLGRLKAEQSERTQQVKALGKDLDGATRDFVKRVGELDDAYQAADKKLRDSLLEESSSLRDEIRSSAVAQTEALDQGVGELRAAKVDRTVLAGMLTDLALQLGAESDE